MLARKCMFARALTASVMLVVSGCATMFTPGLEQDVPIFSRPTGAEVFIDGEFVGNTPLKVILIASESHEVVLRLGGEESVWTLQSTIGTSGGLGLAGDVLIAAPAVYAGVMTVNAGLDPGGCTTGWFSYCRDPHPELVPIGIGIAAVGLIPIVVDLATNEFYELDPKEIVADFE